MRTRTTGTDLSTREVGETAFVLESLERIVKTLDSTSRDERDRTTFLLGFAAFRSSELCAVRVKMSDGTRKESPFIKRSKGKSSRELEIARVGEIRGAESSVTESVRSSAQIRRYLRTSKLFGSLAVASSGQ